MKYWYLVAFATLFWACSESNMAGGTSEEAEGIVAIKDREVAGVTQKGPFLVGSSVTIQELDGKTLIQTGRSFKTSVKTNLGDFAVKNVNLASQYALLEVNGYFRNEVTGKNSEGMISLNALTDLTNRNNVNVNVLTHLETDRVLNLVQKQGLSFADAKKQAESEIFSSFGFTNSLKSPEDMNILSGENGDVLFALSVLMLGNGSVADFSERLALAARSFAESGEWRGPEKGEVVDWAYQIESEGHTKNVERTMLSKIVDNVKSWNIPYEQSYFHAPYIDSLLYIFWINEYGLGPCDKNHSGNMKKVANPHSKYFNQDFVCYYDDDYCIGDGYGCRWYLAKEPVKFEDGEDNNREHLQYKEIGDVFWATENLKYDFHDTVNAKNACYRDVPRYCEMYGTLYDYRTALKACPDGSRLPKYGEVESLLQYYGGAGKNAADSLLVMNDYERDVFGFQALLGGNGEYEGVNENTAMWISSDDSSGSKYVLWIDSSTAEIRPYSSELAYVRCVLDVDSLAAIQKYDVMSDSRDDQLYHYTDVSFNYIDNELMNRRWRLVYVLVENMRYKGDSLYSWNDAVENVCPEGWRLPNIYEWIGIFWSHGDDPSFVPSEDSLQTVVNYNVARTDDLYYKLFGKDKKNTYWTSTEGVFVNSLGENVPAGQVVNMKIIEHNRYDVRMFLDDKLEKHSVRCVKDVDFYDY